MTLALLSDVLILATAISTIALTIANSNLFAGFRDWLDDHFEWLASLVECSYCMTHWIAVPVMIMYQPRLVQSDYAWMDWILSYFALVALSALLGGILMRLLDDDS